MLKATLFDSISVIGSEEITLTPFTDESKGDAMKLLTRLRGINRDGLKEVAKATKAPPPREGIAQTVRQAQLLSWIVLAGGVGICIGGRSRAAVPPPGAIKVVD